MVISRLKKKIPKPNEVQKAFSVIETKLEPEPEPGELVRVSEAVKFRTDKPGFVQINLHVKPGAKVSRVAEITDNHIGLQV